MKIFTVIAVVCYLFVATNSLPTGSPLEICSNINGVPLEEATDLVRLTAQASNDDEKCFLSCYLKLTGYLVNGKLDFDRLLHVYKNITPPLLHDNLARGLKECERKMDYTKNDCDVAYQAYQCADESHP